MDNLAAQRANPSSEVERKVSKAKSLLILDHPFFGMTVSRRPIFFTTAVPTAAMSAIGQMYINPEFAEELTVKNLMFLLAHEALHYMLLHSTRKQHRNMGSWNVACDRVINDTLIDAKVGESIEGVEMMPGARDLSAEQVYQDLPEKEGNSPGGIGLDVMPPTNNDGSQMDDSSVYAIEAQVKIENLQAAKAAKAMGKLPDSVERMIDDMINVSTPWHEILEQFMLNRVRDGYSWSRPNRRFISGGIYIPGYDYVPKMGEVVIGVDTSGSIGQRELDEFNGHINRIIESCGPEKVTVVYCDARVNHVDEFEPEEFPVQLEPHGGGGTSFAPVFDYVDEHGISPEALVYLTDGYGDQDDVVEPSYPTVWLTTGSDDFDWGTVIKFEPEDV